MGHSPWGHKNSQNSQFWMGDSQTKDDHRASSEAVRVQAPYQVMQAKGHLPCIRVPRTFSFKRKQGTPMGETEG